MEIKINLRNNAKIQRMTEGSSGFDIYNINEDEFILPDEIKIIRTGISIEIPRGTEAQIRTRSGLAVKGIFVLNSPGTIDSDYRGG